MPATAQTLAGAGASLAGIGTVAWSNAGNIVSQNTTYATAALSIAQPTSRWLVATQFGFTIPPLAIPLRLVGTVRAKYGTAAASITAATLIVADAVAGTRQTLSQAITGSDANYDIDMPVGALGYPVTAELLNTSTTGFAVSFTRAAPETVSVDAMWLTVYYLAAGRVFRQTRTRRTNRH